MELSDDRSLKLGLVGTSAVLGLYWLPGAASVAPWLRRPLGVADHIATPGAVALTFDDGPHAQGTPAVLRILAEHCKQATFFLVGEQVQRNPGLAAEIVAAGHGVGLHCHRHRNLLRLTPIQVRSDLERARALIEDATGVALGLYRPPYGVLNLAALRWAHARAMTPLLWTHWGRDWEATATAASIAARVTAGTAAGDVLLLHDADDYSAPGSWRRTVAALPRVLDSLAGRGLGVGPA